MLPLPLSWSPRGKKLAFELRENTNRNEEKNFMVSPRVCPSLRPSYWHHQESRPSSLLSYSGAYNRARQKKKKAKSRKTRSGKIRRLSTWFPQIFNHLHSRINFRLYSSCLSLNSWIRSMKSIVRCFRRFEIHDGKGILSLSLFLDGRSIRHNDSRW